MFDCSKFIFIFCFKDLDWIFIALYAKNCLNQDFYDDGMVRIKKKYHPRSVAHRPDGWRVPNKQIAFIPWFACPVFFRVPPALPDEAGDLPVICKQKPINAVIANGAFCGVWQSLCDLKDYCRKPTDPFACGSGWRPFIDLFCNCHFNVPAFPDKIWLSL